MKKLFLSLLVAMTAACASTPPGSAIVQIPQNDIALSEVLASPQQYEGSFVRWGGRVIKVQELALDGQQVLQLEVLSFPLGEKGKPEPQAAAGSRFIARLYAPVDIDRFYRNRLVTVAGEIKGTQEYPLASGELLRLPVVVSRDQYSWRDEYYDRHDERWPRVFYHFGFGSGGSRSGFGIFF